MFRFYSNQLSQATRKISGIVFIVGLLLIGFGLLIMALRDLFVLLAASLFFLAGICTIGYAVRIFFAAGKMSRHDDAFRDNVKIHNPFEDHLE